jgi:hypothetical protein
MLLETVPYTSLLLKMANNQMPIWVIQVDTFDKHWCIGSTVVRLGTSLMIMSASNLWTGDYHNNSLVILKPRYRPSQGGGGGGEGYRAQ